MIWLISSIRYMGNLSNYFFCVAEPNNNVADFHQSFIQQISGIQVMKKQNSSNYTVCIEQIKKYFMRFKN